MTSRLLSIPLRAVTVLAVVGAVALAGCGKKDAAPDKAATAAPPVAGTPVVPPTAPTGCI